jgi:Domain of unknown function (DUF1772)
MATVASVLQVLSAAALGVYAGSMLTEGCVLVPYWRAAPAGEFLAWYGVNQRRLPGFFGPVTWIAGLVAVAAAVAALWVGHPGRWPALAAAVLMALAAASFFVYFERANATFASRTVGEGELAAELRRWAAWHWARTVVSLVALAAALASVEVD